MCSVAYVSCVENYAACARARHQEHPPSQLLTKNADGSAMNIISLFIPLFQVSHLLPDS